MRLRLLALLLPLATSAHAAAPQDPWAGTYTACGQTEGQAWRLTAQAKEYAVAYHATSLEPWQTDAAPARALTAVELTQLNATGSSRDPKDQAQAALIWQNGHFLRLPPGWFDRYRQPGQAFTPDLVFTGGGQALFLCRAPH